MGQPIEGLLVAGGIAFGELLGLMLEAQRPSRRPMSFMFGKATSFNQPLNKWDVSNVRNMYHMFCNATSFNQPLNRWNVSKVIDMEGMFAFARSFNQPLNNWNVSHPSHWRITTMYDMFSGATSFNQPRQAPWAHRP